MRKNRKIRQQKVFNRLETQLKLGTKTKKKSADKIPLIDKDVKRIEAEIQKLKFKK